MEARKAQECADQENSLLQSQAATAKELRNRELLHCSVQRDEILPDSAVPRSSLLFG
jgi:hypothetical protein